MKKNKIACLIPARGGSTRIYNKNIIKINNKSLISYALNSAIKSKMFGDLKFTYPFYMNHQIMLE